MTFVIGMVIVFGCLLGGFAAMGGHIGVLWQPFEYIIILGSAIGTFFVANPMKVVKDTFKGITEAIKEASPKPRDYLDTLAILYALMRELRTKTRTEMEVHVDNPGESEIFKAFPKILADKDLTNFICDYCRLIIIGNARTHEIEALMDEEIQTIQRDKLKVYLALSAIADGLPALGIVAAVLGVIKAMGALDQPPEVLGHLIGAALVGTFAGILFSYGIFGPLATKVKSGAREEGAALCDHQADAACLHERRHAAGRPRTWTQDHFGIRAAHHLRGRTGDDELRLRRQQGGLTWEHRSTPAISSPHRVRRSQACRACRSSLLPLPRLVPRASPASMPRRGGLRPRASPKSPRRLRMPKDASCASSRNVAR